MNISRVKGTEDSLDLTLHNFVLEKAKKHLTTYNYSEILLPIIEQSALFIRSLGEETDVVSKEMFSFTTLGEEEICLRPEATASTMRAFLENKIEELPWKVFTYGPMFRYERPQLGRWRQFSQISIESIGSQRLEHDAQLIAMLDRFFLEVLGIKNYVLKLNFLGVREDREKYKAELRKYLDGVQEKICETCKIRKEKNILRVFDCKTQDCKLVYQAAPLLVHNLSKESRREWERLLDMLSIQSINVVHDPTLVRGLDYYNKTVFEFSSDDLGAQNAFCGGGRYDQLAITLGAAQDYPSVGAAIGMGRLLLLLQQIQNSLSLPQKPALHLVLPMSEEQHSLALLIACHLESAQKCTDILFDNPSIKSMMRKANKMGAQFVLIIGQDEQKAGTVSIKNMVTGASKIVKQSEILEALT